MIECSTCNGKPYHVHDDDGCHSKCPACGGKKTFHKLSEDESL